MDKAQIIVSYATLASAIAATLAVFVALLSLRASLRQNKLQKTYEVFEFLLGDAWDRKITAVARFGVRNSDQIFDRSKSLSDVYIASGEENLDLHADVCHTFEAICIAIVNGVISDEQMFEFYSDQFLGIWRYLREFIYRDRHEHKKPHYYKNMEKIAIEWEERRKKLSSKHASS